ncbi:ABC transporter permease [Sphaerotilus montanus]|uniref:Putative ABC transport system permease protein n=1 Tax=Sphaerotilus montanus TaxID=522889 RepID=A0A7Y9U8L2_9BURK|nr:ABC transporter permease [Sphaerotilus montanus]NYG34992.1 putative ABC transport system permease protein [Sphaerotilus montanus]NZD57832.1 ABC transporter permease [Sphaerotilus montanus]
MELALKDIRRHLGKFLATIVGVAMLLAIVLVMNGIYQGNIRDGVWLIDNTATDLWVVERGRGGPFNEASRIPLDSYKSVAATPGVARASPLVLYSAQREIQGRDQQFTLVGYDIVSGAGGPNGLVQGRNITAPHYEMVVDRKLGLQLGDRVPLGTDDYTVVGVTRGAVDSGGSPLIYMALADAQKVQFEQDQRAIDASRAASLQRLERAGYSGEQASRLLPLLSSGTSSINAVLVTLAPGADGEAVARHIRDWLYLNVYTTTEERTLMLDGKLSKMSAVLGLFRTLLILVSIVIIALIVYVLTIEKIKSIATLKLIGAPNGLIVRLIMTQSMLLTLASFALAYGLRDLIAPGFPRTLAFVGQETAITFAVMLLGGVLASLMAVWHALRTPAQLALGG